MKDETLMGLVAVGALVWLWSRSPAAVAATPGANPAWWTEPAPIPYTGTSTAAVPIEGAPTGHYEADPADPNVARWVEDPAVVDGTQAL